MPEAPLHCCGQTDLSGGATRLPDTKYKLSVTEQFYHSFDDARHARQSRPRSGLAE
jgi:hypothetical protein